MSEGWRQRVGGVGKGKGRGSVEKADIEYVHGLHSWTKHTSQNITRDGRQHVSRHSGHYFATQSACRPPVTPKSQLCRTSTVEHFVGEAVRVYGIVSHPWFLR